MCGVTYLRLPTVVCDDAVVVLTDGAVSVHELETLWAERMRVETPAYLGTHPLRMGDMWLSVCAGFGVLVVGLMLGGWGDPEQV